MRPPDGSFFDERPTGYVVETTIDSLNLEPDRVFGYWFDVGDDWMHQIAVIQIDRGEPIGDFPKIVSRVGESPQQYPDMDDENVEDDDV